MKQICDTCGKGISGAWIEVHGLKVCGVECEPIYVVWAPTDLSEAYKLRFPEATSNGPIVFETYSDNASLKEAKERQESLSGYGKTRIARLVFVED